MMMSERASKSHAERGARGRDNMYVEVCTSSFSSSSQLLPARSLKSSLRYFSNRELSEAVKINYVTM